MIVIADDLTGAADCAAACAGQGIAATVRLLGMDPRDLAQNWPHSGILAIDTNTRCRSAADAAAVTADVARLCQEQGATTTGSLLYKKLDSTLRGHVAAEIAAVLQACRRGARAGERWAVVMAPALPAQGRTTVGGRQRVHGRPVEETGFWERDACAAQPEISAMLAGAGLSCRILDLATVRAGSSLLVNAMEQRAGEADVLVCDAETDADLRAIGQASLALRQRVVWAGSAGLAWHLPAAAGIVGAGTQPFALPVAASPSLFVVGTRAPASCLQAGLLAALPDIVTVRISPAALLKGDTGANLADELQRGRDVLAWLDETENCSDAPLLPRALARLIAPCAGLIGGLVVTGGETARALFDELGIRSLRLLGEVEPGLPVAVTEGWVRALPVLTKAGGFGSAETLLRCRAFLRNPSPSPAAAAQGPLVS